MRRLVPALVLGLLLPPAALAQSAGRPALATPRPARDSFTVMVQGRPTGYQVTELRKTERGYEFTETTRIGTFVEQSTQVSMNGQLEPYAVVQQGRIRGMESHINLAYGDGRVRGDALIPAQPEPRAFAIDTAVAPGTIDDNMLQALLPLLPWGPGARWDLTIFSGGRNVAETSRLAVRDTATVQVPAGSFPVWRAELASGGSVVTFYIERDAPHRLVRITVQGSPLEFVLAKGD